MEIKYCIECEEDVIVDVADGHTIFVPDGTGNYEVDFCYGAFASVQPPVNFEEDWDLNLVEPGQEELAEMNLHAEELYQDFEME
jgi:hypothetical protein